MCTKHKPILFCVVLAVLFWAGSLAAQTSKPITYKGLLNSLKTHGLTNAELTQIVQTRGVDFELTGDKEVELKTAGLASGHPADFTGVSREGQARRSCECNCHQFHPGCQETLHRENVQRS